MVKQGLVIIVFLLGLGVIIYLFFNNGIGFGIPFFGDPQEQEESEEKIVDISDIVDDPVVYEGLTVDVEGELTDWVTKRSFTIGGAGEGLLAGGELLIIRKDEFKLPEDTPDGQLALGEEPTVKVKGTVRLFQRERFEQELGVDLYDEELDIWEEDSVIIAESIEEK